MARLLIRSGGTDPTDSNVGQSTDAGPVTGGKVSATRRVARRWALLVAVGWLVEFGLRVWFSRGQSVPLANPDESAYLIAGRVLAGGPATDFSYSTLYQAGYPLPRAGSPGGNPDGPDPAVTHVSAGLRR